MSNHFSTRRTPEVTPAIPARGPRRPRALGEGAGLAAPTAPHATPPAERRSRRSGPERFWSRGRVRAAFVASLVLSCFAHGLLMPIGVPSGFAVKDVEGEVAIPIDLLESSAAPPEAPPPLEGVVAPPEEDKTSEASGPGAATRVDAGARSPRDAGGTDGASGDAASDAGAPAPVRDGSAGPTDASAGGEDASSGSGAVALADAGGEPSDPHAVAGAVASVQPTVVNVVLVINADVVRRHPVGASLGSLLRGIPQWDDFMSGTSIDPVRDTDWFMVSGPSLVNTERDVVLIHYSAPDAAIDRAMAIVARKYARGGAFDTGIPGVRAVRAHADRAERIILRPQTHVLAVVPPDDAIKVARQLSGARVRPPIAPSEAFYMRLVKPQRPLPELPASITELRLRVVPRADDGADVYVDGDTSDAAEAASAAAAVARIVRRHNDVITSIVTHGLLDRVEVTSEGALVKLHLTATLDQIQTVASVVGAFLGVPAPSGSGAPSGGGAPSPGGGQPLPPAGHRTPGGTQGIH
jgi:hypothetical protein